MAVPQGMSSRGKGRLDPEKYPHLAPGGTASTKAGPAAAASAREVEPDSGVASGFTAISRREQFRGSFQHFPEFITGILIEARQFVCYFIIIGTVLAVDVGAGLQSGWAFQHTC